MMKAIVRSVLVLAVLTLPMIVMAATTVQPTVKTAVTVAPAPAVTARTTAATSVLTAPAVTVPKVIPAPSPVSTQNIDAIQSVLKNEAMLSKITGVQIFGWVIYVHLQSNHTLAGVVNYKSDTFFVCDMNETAVPNIVQSSSDSMMELCKHITSTNAIGRTYSINENAIQYKELFDAAVSLANDAYGKTMKGVSSKNISNASSEKCVSIYTQQSSTIHNKWKISESPSIEFEIYNDSYDCSMRSSGLISYSTPAYKITIEVVLPWFTPLLPTDPESYDGYMDKPVQDLYYNGK